MNTVATHAQEPIDLRFELSRYDIQAEGDCLSEDSLLALVRDECETLPEAMLAHLDACPHCANRYENMAVIVENLRERLKAIFAQPNNRKVALSPRGARADKGLVQHLDFLNYSCVELPNYLLITLSSDELELTGETIAAEFYANSSLEETVARTNPEDSFSGVFKKPPSGKCTVCRIAVPRQTWERLSAENKLNIRFRHVHSD